MDRLLPFQFEFFDSERVLIVNECGDHYFISRDRFNSLIECDFSNKDKIYLDLKSRLFVSDEDDASALMKAAAKYRSRKAFLRDFTSLHMMVVTLRCNHRCDYCQVSCADPDAYKYDMESNTARKIIDTIFDSPSKAIKIEFQGGEPTLHWEAVKESVLYAKEKRIDSGKDIGFVICTNLVEITDDQLNFCRENDISISTSFDGPKDIHDGHRILRHGESAFSLFTKKLRRARDIVGNDNVNALMTTTRLSLNDLRRIVDAYIEFGFSGIFIRSLNPYGFAAEKNVSIGYDIHKFVEAYINALEYIFSVNRQVFFPEYFATLLFSRILTPFSTGFVDLQSPSGAGISGAIYDYDGSVYPSDEARMLARMGDPHFNLGNVHKEDFKAIFGGDKLKDIIRNACVETVPSCALCVYQAYCGTDPVRNYLECGRESRKMADTPFCIKHKAIFDHLFCFLSNISEQDEKIVWRWITRSPIGDRGEND